MIAPNISQSKPPTAALIAPITSRVTRQPPILANNSKNHSPNAARHPPIGVPRELDELDEPEY